MFRRARTLMVASADSVALDALLAGELLAVSEDGHDGRCFGGIVFLWSSSSSKKKKNDLRLHTRTTSCKRRSLAV